MSDHTIGTRDEWQAARDDLAKLEAEQAELARKVTEQRRQLPWVPVEKEYVFDTEDGEKSLAELFDGRSQLLAYNIMFPTTRSAPALAARTWGTSSMARSCISITAT